MEHATAKAREKYLHEHPNADPKDHTVEKKQRKDPVRKNEKEEAKRALITPIFQGIASAIPAYHEWDGSQQQRVHQLPKMAWQLVEQALTGKGLKEVLKAADKDQTRVDDLMQDTDDPTYRKEIGETAAGVRKVMDKALGRLKREYGGDFFTPDERKKILNALTAKGTAHIWNHM